MTQDKSSKVSRLFQVGSGAKKKGPPARRSSWKEHLSNRALGRVGLLLFLSLATVFLAYPMPDSLLMGDVADRDVKADRDLLVEDLAATREKRETAVRTSPLVFDLDDLAAQAVREQIHQVFARGRAILNAPPVTRPIFTTYEEVDQLDQEELAALQNKFRLAFNLPAEDSSFKALLEAKFSIQAERSVFQLVMDLLNLGVMASKEALVEQPDKALLIRRIYTKLEEMAPYGAFFPSLEEARRQVRDRALLYSGEFEPEQVTAITRLAQALLKPNLSLNRKETDERRAAVVKAVAPVYFQVKQGEMIVRVGQRVDEAARMKLEALAAKADRQDWLHKATGFFFLCLSFLLVTCMVGFRVGRGLKLSDRDLVFLAALLLINLSSDFMSAQVGAAMAKGFPGIDKNTIFFLSPAPAFGMLATVFLGPVPGIFFTVVSSALTGLVFDRSLTFFFYCFLGAIAGLAGLVRVRERGAVIKSGLQVALVNLAVIAALSMIEQIPLSRGVAYYFLAGVLNGVLSGVIVAGLIPLLEMVFKYTTNIKLLELANLDKPILRELMVQAPGTYHHSVIVGAMVEAAAEAIGANPLLAKVAAYYHDLGKMNKPLYFVENQTSGENKHEKLAPSLSALILTSHVKEGIELGRQNKLNPEIIDIIQQHHGTGLIAYFYQKAKSGRTEDQPDINIEDYRYPGPKPQTREAGLVLLADAVEAASRSVGEPNPARIQGMVQKIINNIFSDGQLDECELTLKDLHLIARSFNKILTGIFHRRIAYPEPAVKEPHTKAKAANGSNGKQQTKEPPDKSRPDKGQRKDDLRRLGLS
ncbi:MAG: HDIG domain-containing metalloprotein [Thermodesulfobacteriota bacterium]